MSACGQPQICDFGISSILAASSTFGATSSHNYGTRGSLRWMAVEFFEMTDPPVLHSEKSDVWAFGMTVYVGLLLTLALYRLCSPKYRNCFRNRYRMRRSSLNPKFYLRLCTEFYPRAQSRSQIFPTTLHNYNYGLSVGRAGEETLRQGRVCRLSSAHCLLSKLQRMM